MATHSSMLTWKVLQTEEPGGLQPMGSQRVRCDWATKQAIYLKLSPSFLWALIVLVSDQQHWCLQTSVLFFRGTSYASTFRKMILFNEHFRKYIFQMYSLAALGLSYDTRDLPCFMPDSLLQCVDSLVVAWAQYLAVCWLNCSAACGILIPPPGIEPTSPARWILNPWTTRKILGIFVYFVCLFDIKYCVRCCASDKFLMCAQQPI